MTSVVSVFFAPLNTVSTTAFVTGLALVMCVELMISLVVIAYVPYTEIDWACYMTQTRSVAGGEWDYSEIDSPHGPLVYPAGFVWLYQGLRWLSNDGTDIVSAQFVFAALHTVLVGVVGGMARHSRQISLGTVVATVASRRVQSLFVLRLFNDAVSATLAWISVGCAIREWHVAAAIALSLGVGVKMSVLLFAPAMLAVWIVDRGLVRAVGLVTLCGVVQLVLGAPFLWHAPRSYVWRAFELTRQFTFKWSVNWQCVSSDVFLSTWFKVALLILHVGLLCVFAAYKWVPALTQARRNTALRTDALFLVCASANLIGIACARSLHYQFYAWYWHSLPLIASLFAARQRLRAALAWTTLILLEVVYNVYPPHPACSALLHACHLSLLAMTWISFDTVTSRLKAE